MGADNGRRAAIAGFGLSVSAALFASTAAAEEAELAAESTPAPYLFSARATGGLTVGASTGPRAGLSGEIWLLENVGVGGFFAASSYFVDASGQQTTDAVPNPTTSQSVTLAGGSLAVRTASRGSYGYLSLGAGSAWGQTKYPATCVVAIAPAPSTCAATPSTTFSSDLFDITAAYLWHSWGLELGPTVSVDVLNGGVVASLSLGVGFVMEAPHETSK
jgi:hypothetical protein